MGAFEDDTPVLLEASLKYHPLTFDVLTKHQVQVFGQCLVGSLTGAVSSQSVTEEHEGLLMTVGHRQVSAMV